jgi:DNA-binding CsgD family transcriptional regulator
LQPSLVGRERELALIRDCLAAAARAEPRIVLLSGEPGVGKTRLIDEISKQAAAEGWQVLAGQAFDSPGMPPYVPFVEALRPYIRDRPIDALQAQVAGRGADLAIVLPDLGSRLPTVPTADTRNDESDRYRLFDSVSGFLDAIALASEKGLLLSLDDLHWADDSTLLLLEHFARRLNDTPVLIVASYRDTELDASRPLARTLEHITRSGVARRIDLKRLDVDSVRALLAVLGRSDPPQPLVDAVYSETEGNPFFVNEVFAFLAEEGRLFEADGRWRSDLRVGVTEVPQSVRLVIGRRLRRLSATCRTVLGLAAILGRTVEYAVLRSMTDVAEDDLLAALEDAEAARLLVSEDRGWLTFEHELIRQTLLSELTALRRQRLHLRAVDAIERTHANTLDQYLADIAAHLRSAGMASDLQRYVTYIALAGKRALQMRAYSEAAELLGEAITAVIEAPSASREPLLDLHRDRGRAHASVGKWGDARADFEVALEQIGSDALEERAALLIELAIACRWDGDLTRCRQSAEAAQKLADALRAAHLRARADAALALAQFSEGHIEAAEQSYREAIGRPGTQDVAAAKGAEAGYAHMLYVTARHADAIAHGQRAARLARELEDPSALTFALGPLGLSLAASGRFQEAEEAFGEARRVGSQYGIDSYLARAIAMSASPHIDLYDFDHALELSQEAREIAERAGFLPARVSTALDLLAIHLGSGSVERALELLPSVRASVLDETQGRGTWLHGWLWQIRLGQVDAALKLAQRDWSEAERLASQVVETSGARMRPKYKAAALTVRAQAVAEQGRKREALQDFALAIEIARGTGDPALLVRTAAAMATFEPIEAVVDEADRAIQQILDAAPDPMRQPFSRSEAVAVVARAHGGLRPSYPDGLSEREVEVLRLVASGKSNAEIASELVISVNTVQRHVGNILTKTRLANRTQAASYAHRVGLTD